jgi:hypothetical protein
MYDTSTIFRQVRKVKQKLIILAIAAGMVGGEGKAQADRPSLPEGGFAPSHYEVLWTKSPFAVASAEAAQESPDYDLVGVAQIDGMFYACLIDKQSNEHFLLATDDKSVRGLRLISVTRGQDNGSASATIQKDSQLFTLTLGQGIAQISPMGISKPGAPHLLTHSIIPQTFVQPPNTCP